jgi:FKBP-type peptidyl-prolyl cis-trans isomerase FklB
MRYASAFVSLLLALAWIGAAHAQGDQPLPDRTHPSNQALLAAPAAGSKPEVLSYALGFNIGGNMKANEVQVDLKSLMAGVQDGLSGAQPRWTEKELTDALVKFQTEMQQRSMDRRAKQAQANKQQADAFLAQNKQRPGVQVTPSGLQYIVLKQGNGPSPTSKDTVRCHYRGTLIDGTEFDSSGDNPATFMVEGVIPGWTEALQKMRVGDKWKLFVPPDLAYGLRPPGPPLEPNDLLIFEIELLGIGDQ